MGDTLESKENLFEKEYEERKKQFILSLMNSAPNQQRELPE